MAQARFDMPERVRAGEVFKLRLLVQHPMETGYLLDLNNQRIARNVINDMRCTYAGLEVFRIEPSSGLSANPYVEFFCVPPKPARLSLTGWTTAVSAARSNAY